MVFLVIVDACKWAIKPPTFYISVAEKKKQIIVI